MKKRRSLLLILLTLLLFVGLLTGAVLHAYRHEEANHALIAAIYANDTPTALASLKAGADPNTRDHSKDKRLSLPEYTRQLVARLWHPPPAPQGKPLRTALLLHLYVSKQDNPVLVKALLDAGANPNETDPLLAFSPLMWAARGGFPQSLRLLLQHGGNLRQTSKGGLTALDAAAIPGNATCLLLLLDAGADSNAQDDYGGTALIVACMAEHREAVQILLQHHANPNLRLKNGHTALDIALDRNDNQIVGWLRHAGAKTGNSLDTEKASRG